MPFPVEAETTQVYEEARSVLGSLITQIVAIVRTLIDYALRFFRRFLAWSGEHPLACVLTIANICIWVS